MKVENLKSFLKLFILKIILLIQSLYCRVFRKPFPRNKIELIKHRLNFYSHNLKGRVQFIDDYDYIFKEEITKKKFNIQINKFIGYGGSYIYDGEAPLLKSAIEIYKNPRIVFNESYLFQFYEKFQPENYGELYQLSERNYLYNLSSYIDFKPWINDFPNYQSKSKGIFGPIDKNEIEHRFTRLKNLFFNINKFGYLPTDEDIIKGYLILIEDDYKFLITSGHHRIAVLKAINSFQKDKYNKVLVSFEGKRSTIKIVDIKNIKKWPALTSLYCSEDDAREFLKKFAFK